MRFQSTSVFFTNTLCVLCTLLVCDTALAQWKWRDKDEKTIYSDLPPPPSIPDSQILKSPNSVNAKRINVPKKGSVSQDSNFSPNKDKPNKLKQSEALAAQEALEDAPKTKEQQHKIQQEQAQIDQQNQSIRVNNCQSAKRRLQHLQSGQLLKTINETGQSVYMNETTRQQEQKKMQKIVSDNC